MHLAATASAAPFTIISTDVTTQLVPNSVTDFADTLGYFKREGVDVTIVRVQATPSAVAALQAGQGDMANISVDQALLLAAQGTGVKAVTSPNKSLGYVIAAKDSIKSVKDLEGKAFGVARVGSADYSASLLVMRTSGVATDKVSMVAIGAPDVRGQALAAGRIDATTMSYGAWLAVPDKKGLHVLVDQDAYYKAAPVVNKVNVVSAAALKNRGPEIEAVIRALTKASRDFDADPKKWVDAMVVARPDVPRATLEQLAASFKNVAWSTNGGMNAKELKSTQDFTYESPDFKDIKKLTLGDWVDFGPVDAALKTLGTVSGPDTPAR
ncbi:MAG: ABC transporter substrate-binding protein [Bauldia sp.]